MTATPTDMNRRAVVSGGSGFLGRELCKRMIQDGWVVQALVRNRASAHHLPPGAIPLEVPDSFPNLVKAIGEQRPDRVFHLASAGGASHLPADIPGIIEANVTLGCALLEACRLSDAHFVGVGTFWQHQIVHGIVAPNSLYAAAKQALEDVAMYYRHTEGVRCVILKPYDIYGPGDDRGRFLSALAQASLVGRSVEATAGEQQVCFVHVQDVVGALLAAEESIGDGEGAVDISFGVPGPATGTLRSTIESLAYELDIELNVNWGSLSYRPNEVMRPADIPILPGWRPAIGLPVGFAELMDRERRLAETVK